MSLRKYSELPSVALHTLQRAHDEAGEEARARHQESVARMCELLESRRSDLVQRWVDSMSELLPERTKVHGVVPAWWKELADKFLNLFIRHLVDTEDIACHRFVRVITRAGHKAGFNAAELVCTQIALKRCLIAELVHTFRDDSEQLRNMCDRVETEIDHIRLHIAECFYEYNEKELLTSEQKHWALFNSAGDAVVLADPRDGTIIEANREAEALFGLDKDALLTAKFPELFDRVSRQDISDRLQAATQEGASFLDHARLTSGEGHRVHARVRSTLISYGGARVVQSLIRDETGLWQGDAGAPDDPAALERMVAVRTRELYEAQKRYRSLYRETRRQVDRMAMLREVAEAALRTRTVDDLMALTAESIRHHFRFFDISVFSVDGDMCVLRAHSGGYENLLRDGYRQSISQGIVGETARTLAPVTVNDVSRDPRYFAPFPGIRRTRSELAVPVVSGGQIKAVIDAQSQNLNAFNDGDMAILQAVAGELALALEKSALHEATLRAQEFSDQIIQSMPFSLITLDGRDVVTAINQRFGREANVDPEASVGKHIAEVVEPALLEQSGLPDMLAQARATGETVALQSLHHWSPNHPDRFLDIRVKPLGLSGRADVMVLINNVTDSSRRIFQLDLMYRVSRLIQSALDEDYVLHAALTCITAGPALGFNRGFVLLANEDETELVGRVAVGPRDEEEAGRIYAGLAEEGKDLRELVAEYDGPQEPVSGSLHDLVRQVRIPLKGHEHCPLGEVYFSRRPKRVSRDDHGRGEGCCALGHVMDAEQSAVAALESGDRTIGVVVADNRFTRAPINDEDVRLLATVARNTGMALANARAHAEVATKADQLAYAYRQLREAHDDLVRHEKLAAAGEMSARVSHEIRNPLVTIGGFARGILRDQQASERTLRNARIMVGEVEKLEAFLTNWLDLARPADSVRSPEDLNAVVEHALLMANVQALPEGIEFRKDLAEGLPPVVLDARRIQQAVMNVALNAIQAMNGTGELSVCTRREGDAVRMDLSDTGGGIPQHLLDQIFTPFFTTKLSGSGLGLAVTQSTVKDHGGRLEIQSVEGEGTTVSMWLPLVGEASEGTQSPG